MISVVIPARNAAGTIGAALSSLDADRQLIGEILLIDDGSDDSTVAEARTIAERDGLPLEIMRVGFGNAGAARNAGIAKARGDCIFFLDADDQVIPGGVALLRDALRAHPEAGLAVGASIHRASHSQKFKVPGAYGADRTANARAYLLNELRSITVGSALVSAKATVGVRFPERIGLDEDTLYWAAILTRARVATIEQPVLVYNLDQERMAERFVANPRKVFLDIALELEALQAFGIDKATLRKRKVFIAQRIARHLIRRRRFEDAARMMRAVPIRLGRRHDFKSLQYRARIAFGLVARRLGFE
ncbi:MAG: glycosyltransferase family A protein [Hyphomicrobiales bacterium]|nr:glycosyltransferase family A protein [Hyphomicrobiales bacterium]